MSELDNPSNLGSGRLGFASEADVDSFVSMLDRFERSEVTPDEWRAFRLVNGVYGQRQDDEMMIRVKIPQGILGPSQLSALAEVAEKWSNGKGHVTTRQNVQIHFVKLANTEEALRLLADAGLTTREACGNSVRNVTGCPFAGTAASEPFDATPYADVVTRHFLRGPLSASLPRKFKIALGGCCGGGDCVQAAINDLGFLSRLDADGRPAFRVTIGGGLATLRRSGFVAHELLPAEQILEVAEAVVRVFDRIGNRKDKHKARLKWAIDRLGVKGFLEEYEKELGAIRAEGGRPFTLPPPAAAPERAAAPRDLPPPHPDFARFARDSVRLQKQMGFSAVTVRLTLGDITAAQLRGVAWLAVVYGEGEVRATNEQNLVMRFVPTWQVPALHRELVKLGLGQAGARSAADVTACPGSASCKLAVTASRGVASLVTEHLEARPELAELAPGLDIKVSGCPNGCAQHYVAGISLQGGVRKVAGRAVPQYHVSLGGNVGPAGAEFARMVGKIPARRIGVMVERLVRVYAAEKQPDETPDAFFRRLPLAQAQALLKDLGEMDAATAQEDDFVDLGETGAFKVVLSEGECAA